MSHGNETDFGPHLDHQKVKSLSKLTPNTEISTQLNFTLPFFLTKTVSTLIEDFKFNPINPGGVKISYILLGMS